MQPVQFQCGHCGKLMAVSTQYLGQQVRCPHCQQVVIAPPAAAATATASRSDDERTEISSPSSPPQPSLPDTVLQTPASPHATEGIFSPVHTSSDLFSLNETPGIDIPLETLPPTLPGDNAIPAPEEATLASTLPWGARQPAAEPPDPLSAFGQSESTAVMPGGAAAWVGGSLTEIMQSAPAALQPASESQPSAASARTVKRTEAKAPWFLLLVFCPLLLYSIVISIFAFFIYRDVQRLQERIRNPFETMPDVGDDPGVRKGKKASLLTDRYKPELARLPLPESLCTTLGKPLRVGDLQVTPNRVERKRVSVIVEAAKPEPCKHDSLVLYLNFRNLSAEYAFAPLDNYFDRYWRPGSDLIPPLTLLEVGDKRYYGGPAHWYPRGDPSNRREWIKGRRDQADLLQPGEEKEMFVCTDGDDDNAAAVLFGEQPGEEYHGPFLWRVRVRRGLMRFQDKDYPATAVIGVRFTESDIHQPTPEVQ